MIMKTKQLLTAFAALWTGVASAQTNVTSFSFNVNAPVPDASPLGLTLETNLTLSGNLLSSVAVSLNVSGGYNGDLYAYLAGPAGGFAVLLNRAGVTTGNNFGYSGAGFNVTFNDLSANGDFHLYQNVGGYAAQLNGGNWRTDGRNIDPLSAPSLFGSAPQNALLSSFANTSPSGNWTLFVADLSGGGQSTVVGWGLNIETIPEPSLLALAGVGFAGLWFATRHRWSQPRCR